MDIVYTHGPRDPTILCKQQYHRSEDVIEGDVDRILDIKQGHGLFWTVSAVRPNEENAIRLHERVVSKLYDMGFYGVYRCGHFEVDHHLITALVERWRPETHTFHFPVGEATVTLQDVAILWGLAVDGAPLIGIDVRRTTRQWQQYCLQYLGFEPEPSDFKGSRILSSALRDFLVNHPVEDDSPNYHVEQYARGCALMLIGSVMCPDSSSNMVSLLYLHHMERIEDCNQVSWGSAVLAFLYRELCTASHRGKNSICGPMQLLQVNILFIHIKYRTIEY